MKLLICLLAVTAARGEIRDVMKRADIEAKFAGLRGVNAVHEKPNYAIEIRVAEGKPGPPRPAANDQVWFARRGSAQITLGEARHEISAGDVIHVPRSTPHQVDPGAGRFEYIAVRIIPEKADPTEAWRKFYTPRRMPDVVERATIEETIAKSDANQPLHAAANFTVNYVIYKGRSGPWEAHRGCVDIYFIYAGTAKAQLGGMITNPKEDPPGEIRGDAVTGAREHAIAPGDIVVIPRNGVHHMDPGPEKLGYLLMKVWVE